MTQQFMRLDEATGVGTPILRHSGRRAIFAWALARAADGALGRESPPLIRVWWLAIRPKTLLMSLTPVMVGTALTLAQGVFRSWSVAFWAFFAAVLIQAATNLHNDAADFERGNDGPQRLGPMRVTAQGWLRPSQVKSAAYAAFFLAFLIGIYLAYIGGWPIIGIGIASLVAGWGYSGGVRPISHTSLGEWFVLIFFGVFAVAGSDELQRGHFSLLAIIAGLAVGAPAAAVLLVNNTRDIAEDLAAGRRTLASIWGPAGAIRGYCALLLMPFLLLPIIAQSLPGALVSFGALPFAINAMRRFSQVEGAQYNGLLGLTSRLQLVFGALMSIGICLYPSKFWA